jgi:hypothetical protein
MADRHGAVAGGGLVVHDCRCTCEKGGSESTGRA